MPFNILIDKILTASKVKTCWAVFFQFRGSSFVENELIVFQQKHAEIASLSVMARTSCSKVKQNVPKM